MRVQVPILKNSVGEPVTGTIALLTAIITAVKIAVEFVIKLIDAFKDNDRAKILAASESVGTPNWGPQENDWLTGGMAGFDSDTLLLLLGGLAAVYFINE